MTDFQTPNHIAEYMASMLPNNCGTILEPTPGDGNLVSAVMNKGTVVCPTGKFEDMDMSARYDWAIMNPPFTPMAEGYRILKAVMNMSDNIIALMPWLVIINSRKRTQEIMSFGLKSITHLPRNIFAGARAQCCILELRKSHKGITEFKTFTV